MSRLRSLFAWFAGCHKLWAVCFAAAFVNGLRDPLWHGGWSPRSLVFQVSVMCCGVMSLEKLKVYMLEGVAFRVDSDGGVN
jgi:hypothetical protein